MPLPTVEQLVDKLKLQPHPEGGFFTETFRDAGGIAVSALPSGYPGERRSFSTAIYFLLRGGDVSHLHRIRSAELWHHYMGRPLTVVEIAEDGSLVKTTLGPDILGGQKPQHVVPAGRWFGSYPAEAWAAAQAGPEFDYCLVGCTVAPGFDFADFELAKRGPLLERYPALADEITKLTDPE